VQHLRILLGDEVSLRTQRVFAESLRKIQQRLEASAEEEKRRNDFLEGVPAIVEAMRTGQIQCRVYRKEKFHAKCYLTHAPVVGSFGLVGSSNFTVPGLSQNIELNVQIRGPDVDLLQDWYDRHWELAEEVTPDLLRILERHTEPRLPFEIWFKALDEFFRGRELTPDGWDQHASQMFGVLDKYQQDAYRNLLTIAQRFQGAFLCDGVGLGKTFVGLMLLERMVVHAGQRVVLFAPKAAREDVWAPAIKHYLPHLNSRFVNFVLFNHTDLQRKGAFQSELELTLRDADVVIIDEAHHFRNPGVKGEGVKKPSRYRKLQTLLQTSRRPKTLFLLTAMPVNNSVQDFRRMIELFTGGDERYFTGIGIHSLPRYFADLEKQILGQLPTLSYHLPFNLIIIRASLLTLFRSLAMSRSISIEITESAEELKELMNEQTRAKFRERLQILYWIKTERFRSLQDLADYLGRSKSVIVKWLRTYRTQGLAALLEWNYHGGRRSKLSEAVLNALQQRLNDPWVGFNSYKEVKLWLFEEQGLEIPYSTVHRIVRYQLHAKLKVARPMSIHRDDTAVVEFKKTA